MTRPSLVDDYNSETKRSAEIQEKGIVELEHGKKSKLPPDLDRPCYLFEDRKKILLRVLQ